MEPDRSDPQSPDATLSGRFELRDVIGRGGTSLVYSAVDRLRADDSPENGEVAVKVTTVEGEDGAELAELVHREARLLGDLVHPNIVRVYESGSDHDRHYLVMELLRGRAAPKLLSTSPERRLPAETALRIIGQAATGLAYAHAQGVAHGDVKPGNLFVTTDGAVKLLDFGAARRLDEPSPGAALERDGLGALTPLYASPEAIAGEPPEETDDVFSLACVAYVMLTGRHPWSGKNSAQARDLGLTPERPTELSASQWRMLQQGLAFEREERPSDIAAFAQRLARPSLSDRLWAMANVGAYAASGEASPARQGWTSRQLAARSFQYFRRRRSAAV